MLGEGEGVTGDGGGVTGGVVGGPGGGGILGGGGGTGGGDGLKEMTFSQATTRCTWPLRRSEAVEPGRTPMSPEHDICGAVDSAPSAVSLATASEDGLPLAK